MTDMLIGGIIGLIWFAGFMAGLFFLGFRLIEFVDEKDSPSETIRIIIFTVALFGYVTLQVLILYGIADLIDTIKS